MSNTLTLDATDETRVRTLVDALFELTVYLPPANIQLPAE
jgi:hypothetical protein